MRAVAALHVDREPEVHVLVADDDRLVVLGRVRRVEPGEVVERAEHRVGDEVGEADLARAGARQLVVEDLAVDLEQLGGDRRAPTWRWAPPGWPPCSRPCAPPRPAGARARRRRAPSAPGAVPPGGAGGAVAAAGGAVGGVGAPFGGGACPGEVGAPVVVDRRRVLEVALVELLHQPGVRTEVVEAGHGSGRPVARPPPARLHCVTRGGRAISDAGARPPGTRGPGTAGRSGADRSSSRTAARGGRRGPRGSHRGTR